MLFILLKLSRLSTVTLFIQSDRKLTVSRTFHYSNILLQNMTINFSYPNIKYIYYDNIINSVLVKHTSIFFCNTLIL